MIDGTALAAITVPAVSLGASGVMLGGSTRTRLAGSLLALAAAGAIGSGVALHTGRGSLGQVLQVASIDLVGAMALLAYPHAHFAHLVDFCAWVVVVAAGVTGTVGFRNVSVYSSTGFTIVVALTGQRWWRLETGDEPDRQVLLLACAGNRVGRAALGPGLIVMGGAGTRSTVAVLPPVALSSAMIITV